MPPPGRRMCVRTPRSTNVPQPSSGDCGGRPSSVQAFLISERDPGGGVRHRAFLADVVDVLLRVHEGAVGERAVDRHVGREAAVRERVRDVVLERAEDVGRVGGRGGGERERGHGDRDGVERVHHEYLLVDARDARARPDERRRGRPRRWRRRPQGVPRLAARAAAWDDGRMRRTVVALAISSLGLAAGLFTLDAARDDPGYWFAGASTLDAAVLLVTGWALIGCGVVAWVRQPAGRFGPLFAAAGFAWFLLEWNNPGIDSALAFTVGLCLYASCPPLVAHAVLSTPPGRRLLAGRGRRARRSPTPRSSSAWGFCPRSSSTLPRAAARSAPRTSCSSPTGPSSRTTSRGSASGPGSRPALVLAGLVGRRLLQASTSPRRAFLGAGALYLALVAAVRRFVARPRRARERRLGAAALARPGGRARGCDARHRMGVGPPAPRPVGRRAPCHRPGRGAAARRPPRRARRDRRRPDARRGLSARAAPTGSSTRRGDPSSFPPRRRSRRSSMTTAQSPYSAHAPGLLDDAQLVTEASAAARLALENERLHAEIAARLDELRRSRARIVDTADAERRRLERDLHDGAQQRLVGLSLTLGLVRSRLPPAPRRRPRSRKRTPNCAPRSRTCASSRTGSSRPSSPTRASARRSRRSRRRRACR